MMSLYGDRALLIHGAVWSESTSLSFANNTAGNGLEYARRVTQSTDCSDGKVQAWDVASLIDKTGSKIVDLLKIDIERAELAVFGEGARSWLPRVRNICIELHGPDCEEVFFNALSDFDYELDYSGELFICRNIRTKTLPV